MPRWWKTFILFSLLLDTGCELTSSSLAEIESRSIARTTAEEIAAELGLPTDPTERMVAKTDLAKYPVTLDVFRQSKTNPPIGEFRPEYVGILVPESSLPESERTRLAELRFRRLAQLEFAIASRDGIPYRLNLVSVGSSEPDGNFRIDVVSRTTRLEAEDGPSVPVSIPFPWLRSSSLPAEPMTWGLWMHGGYFVQSTPFYADLGLPTLHGGVHQALPDAMALYSEAQTRPAVARIHVAGSTAANERLRELAPLVWVVEQLDASRIQIDEAINVLGGEVRLLGHGWVDPMTGELTRTIWPKCGVFDCFKSWNVIRPDGR